MVSETARIFNSAIGASAIAASFELGLLDALHESDVLDIEALCRERDLHTWPVTSILQALHRFDIVHVSEDGKTATPGPGFQQAFEDKGYFLWLVRGYGNLLHNLASIVEAGNCTTEGIVRDGKYIAMAGRDYGARYVDEPFDAVLAEVPFRVVGDLGCGSAERLIKILKQNPEVRGVGVEVNKGAVDLARRSVAKAGLEERLKIVHSDVKNLILQEEFEEVEVLFCFFMGHDLWPRQNCLKALRSIRAAFPKVARFLLCDTYRSDLPPAEAPPVFTLGFEFTHALMGQYIPNVAEWKELFTESGWDCIGNRDIAIPYSTIFDLRSPGGSGGSQGNGSSDD